MNGQMMIGLAQQLVKEDGCTLLEGSTSLDKEILWFTDACGRGMKLEISLAPAYDNKAD